MDFLVNNYGVDSFNFTDDLMFFNEKQAIEIAKKFIESGISNKCAWIGETRIDSLHNQEVFDLLYQSGCRNLIFGVETNSTDMQKVLNKKVASQEVEKVVEMCAKASITPLLTFMLGLPGETENDILKTVELVKKLDKAICCCQLYTPTPGSKIYEDLVIQGTISKSESVELFSKVIFGEKLTQNISNVSTKE
jgi:radical SAM superfamily enzyme YgiQ (UPF0313 family)